MLQWPVSQKVVSNRERNNHGFHLCMLPVISHTCWHEYCNASYSFMTPLCYIFHSVVTVLASHAWFCCTHKQCYTGEWVHGFCNVPRAQTDTGVCEGWHSRIKGGGLADKSRLLGRGVDWVLYKAFLWGDNLPTVDHLHILGGATTACVK